MNSDARLRSLFTRSVWALLLALCIGLLTTGGPAFGATGTPAQPPPGTGADARWNASSSLKPAMIIEDFTWFAGHSDPKNGDTRLFYAVDIENGILFAATGQGLEIVDVRGGPTSSESSYIYGYHIGGAFPGWFFAGDADWFVTYLDAPAGNPNVLALSMDLQGFSVVNTTNPSSPVVAYHGTGPHASTGPVYSVRAANTDWAYAITTESQVVRFNLTAASGLNRCLDTPTSAAPSTACQGVYRGAVSSLGTAWVTLHGAGDFLATGKWKQGGLVKIWSLADPAAPSPVLQLNSPAMGLAMWQQGGSYYLARLDATKKLWIHDVSCIAGGACTNAPVVWSQQLSAPRLLTQVTVSQAGGRTYLYVGGDDLGSCVPQREYLFDVTTPATASQEDLTPKVHASGYWGWYYQDCSTGFNLVGPRMAKVYASSNGTHLYRAAMSLLDAHTVGSQTAPPVSDFSWAPSEIYPGTEVQFTDASSGSPNQWTWTFHPDGNVVAPSTTGSKHPKATFNAPGQKTVTLRADSSQNGPGTSLSKTLTVLDPAPKVASVTRSAERILQCQSVTFTANGVTGHPAPGSSWVIQGPSGPPGNGTTNPYEWTTTASTPPGTHNVTFTATNSAGSASKSTSVIVDPVLPITATSLAPTRDDFTAGEVQFHLGPIANVTAWSWDFDDDNNDATSSFGPWITNEDAGRHPKHSYLTTNPASASDPRKVRVKVTNCVSPEITSAPLDIYIEQITPLQALFSIAGGALCFPGTDTCTASTGTNIVFQDASTGADAWWFDWDGNNVYEEGPLTASAFENRTIRHAYTTQGTFTPKLKVTRGASEQHVYTLPKQIIVSGSGGGGGGQQGTITIGGAASGQPNASLIFTASGGGSCSPSSNGWTWNLAGGTATGSTTGNQVTVSWASEGAKTITASNSACSGVSGTKTVTISSGNGGGGGGGGGSTLKADFTYSPAAPVAGQPVSFNGAVSQGSPETYEWRFGGEAPVMGAQVSRTFAQPGAYQVRLTVAKQGTGAGCQVFPGVGSICSAEVVKTVVVGSGTPPLVAGFNSDICNNVLGLCTTDTGKAVTFTDSSTGNIISRTWDFGDGETATGTSVTHIYKRAGTYQLSLSISDGSQFKNFTRTIVVNGVLTESMVLPWIGKAANGPLQQSSDLYLHNPSASPIDVTLEFIQRGNVGSIPPVKRTIAANATLFVSDVVKSMFGLDNMTGFLSVKIDQGDVQPVLISFNTTFRSGGEFGQTIPGFVQSNTGASATTGNNQVQHLVGLNDNDERLAYFGFSNPADGPVTYTLRFFDNQGKAIGTGEALTLGPRGAKQFQTKEIRTRFGLTDKDDYRVVVETPRNSRLFPYGANVRIGSADPSFLTVGTGTERAYLLGALSTPGMNNSVWRSDLVLANTSNEVVIADISFTNVGATSQSTDVIHESLQPGETRRLADVIGTKWNIRNGVGVLTIDSNAPGGQFPVVQGESYENTNPSKRYGQTLPALTDAQAAGPGQGQYLVGLRQDAKYRTTFWMLNPSNQSGLYDVVFRNLQGQELGRLANVALGAGKLRQLNQAQFPAGLSGGFTVQIIVKQGKGLAAAQVVNNVTNDPAYVQGETR